MKIYKTAVCSLLTYGIEAWHLNEQIIAMINGANARLLSRFTGKDTHQEAIIVYERSRTTWSKPSENAGSYGSDTFYE